MPTRRAMARVDQWVAFSGWLSSVRGDHPFDGRVRDGTWRTGAGQVDEAVEAMGEETGAPRRDAHPADAEITGNATVGRSRLSAGQHDPRALSQGLADIATADEPRQARALVLSQMERSRFWTTGHRSPPCGHPPHVGANSQSETALLTQPTSITWALWCQRAAWSAFGSGGTGRVERAWRTAVRGWPAARRAGWATAAGSAGGSSFFSPPRPMMFGEAEVLQVSAGDARLSVVR